MIPRASNNKQFLKDFYSPNIDDSDLENTNAILEKQKQASQIASNVLVNSTDSLNARLSLHMSGTPTPGGAHYPGEPDQYVNMGLTSLSTKKMKKPSVFNLNYGITFFYGNISSFAPSFTADLYLAVSFIDYNIFPLTGSLIDGITEILNIKLPIQLRWVVENGWFFEPVVNSINLLNTMNNRAIVSGYRDFRGTNSENYRDKITKSDLNFLLNDSTKQISIAIAMDNSKISEDQTMHTLNSNIKFNLALKFEYYAQLIGLN